LVNETLRDLKKTIKEAICFLEKGEPIAFPTETVYGIGGYFDSFETVKKIYEIKKRPKDNPLIVHIGKKSDFFDLVETTDSSFEQTYVEFLVEKFFPGPLTLVLKKKQNFNWNQKIFKLETIALRMPSLKITQELIKVAGLPLVAASANLSGRPSATKPEHVENDFQGKIKYILKDSQKDQKHGFGLESTVIDCQESKPRLLRAGSLAIEEINGLLKRSFNLEIDRENYLKKQSSSKKILCPGLKYKHYAPQAEVKIVDLKNLSEAEKICSNKKRIAFLGSERVLKLLKQNLNFQKFRTINSLEDYAQVLFDFFRKSDLEEIEIILCEAPSRSHLGLAIYERLFKASS